MLGTIDSRRRVGRARGGDPTYGIDLVAEDAVWSFFSDVDDVAWFTEERGLMVRGRPRYLFLVDPVDGSRPAAAGYGSCCVSVAVAPFGREVTLADVSYGCVVELASGASFEARRGAGRRGVVVRGRSVGPSSAAGLRGLFWGDGFRGQPALLLAACLSELFDRIGGGYVLNTTTYDVAAAYLLLRKLGCPVTDAAGTPLDDVPLLEDGGASLLSIVAASNGASHDVLVAEVRAGVERAERLMGRCGAAPIG